MVTINQPDQLDYLLERRRLVPLIKCGIEKLESIVHKLESDIVPKSCPQSALSCLEKESEEKCLASKRSRHPAQESREVLPAQRSATTEFRPGTSAARCSIHRLSRGRCVLWSVLNRIVWKLLWAVSYSGHIHSFLNAGCLWDRGTGLLPAGWRLFFYMKVARLYRYPVDSLRFKNAPYHVTGTYRTTSWGREGRGKEGRGVWVRAAMHHQQTTQWVQSRLSPSGPAPKPIGPFEMEIHSFSTATTCKSCTL